MTEIMNQNSRPQDDQGITREAWLHRAIEAFRPRFTEIGLPLPARVHVSVGFGYSSRAESKYILGQCWARRASADGVNHIFLGPQEGDPAAMLVSLLHELIHAADDCASGPQRRLRRSCHPARLRRAHDAHSAGPGPDRRSHHPGRSARPVPARQARPHRGRRARARPARRRPCTCPRPRRQGAQRPRQAGNPHDQAARRMLRLHRPHHPQMGRPGLPALPPTASPCTRSNPPRNRPNLFKRPPIPEDRRRLNVRGHRTGPCVGPEWRGRWSGAITRTAVAPASGNKQFDGFAEAWHSGTPWVTSIS